MTSRERIRGALRRESLDYVPCCAMFSPLARTLRAGHRWQFPWGESASLEERLRYQVGQLGLDQVVEVRVNLCRPADGVEARAWLEGGVLHKVWRTPAGELRASVRYDEKWPHGEDIPLYDDFSVAHYVKPWIENEKDLECFRQVVRLNDTAEVLAAARSTIAAARDMAGRFSLATVAHVGMGLTGGQELMGAEPLCMLTLDNPGLVDAYMEHEHRINLRTIELMGEGGVDIVRRNGFYETADFYGPDMLERFVGPRVRREADAARAHGMLTSYTVHTGLAPILDYLTSLGVDSFFGMDIAFHDLDLHAVRRAFAGRQAVWTGPSSTYHLWKGPEATREAVRKVFSVFGKTGLILAPCVSAHSIMPWESTLAMIEEWKRLR